MFIFAMSTLRLGKRSDVELVNGNNVNGPESESIPSGAIENSAEDNHVVGIARNWLDFHYSTAAFQSRFHHRTPKA
jgi:hypothetical protein